MYHCFSAAFTVDSVGVDDYPVLIRLMTANGPVLGPCCGGKPSTARKERGDKRESAVYDACRGLPGPPQALGRGLPGPPQALKLATGGREGAPGDDAEAGHADEGAPLGDTPRGEPALGDARGQGARESAPAWAAGNPPEKARVMES